MGEGYQGTTALVTGASKGLGRAYAQELTRRGARVILVSRTDADLRELAGQIGAQHTEVIAADLTAPDGPAHIIKALHDRDLTVDLLVNNAGAGSAGPFLGRPLEPQLRSVGLNVTGLMALTHLLGADMVARGRGGIINVSSTAAFQPLPYQASYAATKAFVLSFTEALAEELRGTGVQVMAAHPGAIRTGFFDGTTAKINPAFADTPASVAARTLNDFARGRTVSYPGRGATRAMTWTARVLPRTVVARLAGALNRRLHLHEVTDVA